MPRFYVYMKGDGEGCDYTVGCNEKLELLKSESLADAMAEARTIFDDHGGAQADPAIERLEILEATVHPCDVQAWSKESQDQFDQESDEARLKELTAEKEKIERRLGR